MIWIILSWLTFILTWGVFILILKYGKSNTK